MRAMPLARLACLSLLLSVSLGAAARDDARVPAPADVVRTMDCAGHVFLDRDGDGRMEAGEIGVAGTAVSDGERITRSDANGHYRLDARVGRSVFLIKPAGYRVARRADGLPDTWVNLQPDAGPVLRYGGVPASPARCRDFALQADAQAPGQPLDVLVFGDPQPKSLVDIDYYARDIVAPLLAHPQATLGISLGDLVNDDLSLYPALKAVDARLGLPWLHAPGNHDLDFDAAHDDHSLDSYRQAFGPDTRAWEEPQANFIVLDDVVYQPGAQPSYVGGLRESQFAYLAAYLEHAPKERLLVLAMHIPLFDPVPGVESFRKADRERLFALLRPFPNLLVLSAHTHQQQHFFHGAATGWQGAAPLHEYNVGAGCGAFWTGIKDAAGIPAATMSDGTPNGYARLRIADGKPVLRWFVARAPEALQIGLHAPRVLRRGSYPAFGVYANVYMGSAGTRVEYRIDDGDWKPLKRVLQPDPALQAENALDDAAETLRGYDRSPEAAPSTHLWRGTLPTDLAPGEHRVSVRADIEGFGESVAETRYRLDEAAP
jgi:3',5'-cyclic AMP phosphodiesterase CpdA